MLIDAGPHRHQEQDPPSSVSVALQPHPLPLSPLLTPLGCSLFQLVFTSHSGWPLLEGINLVLAITRFPDPAGDSRDTCEWIIYPPSARFMEAEAEAQRRLTFLRSHSSLTAEPDPGIQPAGPFYMSPLFVFGFSLHRSPWGVSSFISYSEKPKYGLRMRLRLFPLRGAVVVSFWVLVFLHWSSFLAPTFWRVALLWAGSPSNGCSRITVESLKSGLWRPSGPGVHPGAVSSAG